MRKLKLLLCFVVLSVLFSSCFKEDETDREEIVKMTIYPETGYGGYVFSQDMYGEFLLFSESDNQEKRILTNGGNFSDNFNYEKGYKYKLEAKKTFLENPPQDGSSIQYGYIKMISKEKVITENSETNIEVTVSDKTVKFMPRYPTEYEEIESEDGEIYEQPKVFDALYMEEDGDNSKKIIVTGIEGFDYEEGYEYILKLKKKIQAEPYAVEYSLVEILSKEEID